MSWQCRECEGTGRVFAFDEVEPCPKCAGLGYTTMPPKSVPTIVDHDESDE